MATKLVILDRDGVINVDQASFIKSPAEWMPIPGSLEAIARLNQADYRVVIATNQSGVARGLFDLSTLNAIHQKMHAAALAAGAEIDSIFFCPHAASDDCDCRKPKPGMFNAIGKRYDVKIKGIPAIGDSLRDLQAAFIAGCTPYLVLTGKGRITLENGGLPPGTITHPDLSTVVDFLLSTDHEKPNDHAD